MVISTKAKEESKEKRVKEEKESERGRDWDKREAIDQGGRERERERDVEEREKFNRIIRNMFSIFTIHLY